MGCQLLGWAPAAVAMLTGMCELTLANLVMRQCCQAYVLVSTWAERMR